MVRIKDDVTLPVQWDKITEDSPRIKFVYVNWRGVSHEYVVEVESVTYGRSGDSEVGPDWYLHGDIITRDDDPREDMGPTRRRSFKLIGIKDPKEVER